jgi:hypothetical protein
VIKSWDAPTVEELLDAQDRVLNPAAQGMSFMPQKKSRFSSNTIDDYSDIQGMPTISELPKEPDDMQAQMLANWWPTMIQMIDSVRSNSAHSQCYESEILRLSDDMDQL